MINLDISLNRRQNRKNNNDPLGTSGGSDATIDLDEELGIRREDEDDDSTTIDLDTELSRPRNVQSSRGRSEPQGDDTGHLSGATRDVANITGASINYGMQAALGLTTNIGTWVAGLANAIGRAIPEVTIFGESHPDRPLSHTPHGWLPPEAQQEINEKYYRAAIAEVPLWTQSQWTRGRNAVDQWINGKNKSFRDSVTHGAGTAVGFAGASAGIRAGINALIKGLPPVDPRVKIAKFILSTLEASTESAGFLTDQYMRDPSLFRSPEKLAAMAKLSGMNFAANAIPDYLLDMTGDYFGSLFPVTGLAPKAIKGILGELFKENIQESYQTATERATEKTFKSGDFSIGNFLSNLMGEYRNIVLPYTDEQGNQHSGYLWEQMPEVSASTALSTIVMGALGLPNPRARGHIFTQQGRQTMQDNSNFEDWETLRKANDPARLSQWEEQHSKLIDPYASSLYFPYNDEVLFGPTQNDADALQKKLELLQRRDYLRSKREDLYARYGSLGVDADTNPEAMSEIADLEREIGDIEQKFGSISSLESVEGDTRSTERRLARLNRYLDAKYGLGVITNPVQDDAGLSLFADKAKVRLPDNPEPDNPEQDTQHSQNIPPITEADTAQPVQDEATESVRNAWREEMSSLGIVPDEGSDFVFDDDGNIVFDDDNQPLIQPVDSQKVAQSRTQRQGTAPDLIPEVQGMQDNSGTLPNEPGLQQDSSAYDDIDDEPDEDLDAGDYSERYNQAVLGGNTQDSSDDSTRNVGTFIFSAGIGSNARDYSFNVVSSHAGLSHGRTLAERYHSRVYADRMTRWNGSTLEVRTKRGEVVATYTPYLGGFYFSPEFDSKHSPRWKAKFQRDFMANVRTYLNNGGFLDMEGNLKPDGNEAFRERWRARRAVDGWFSSFSSNELQQEDLDAPNVGTLSVSYQNGEGREVTTDLSVEIGTFGDDMPEQRQYYGRHLNIRDKSGRLIARYSPRAGRIQFTKNGEAQAMKKSVMEKLKRKGKTILKNAGFLDEKGKLIPDYNEGYRERRNAANSIPSSIPVQTEQDTQGISSVTPLGEQETVQNTQQETQPAPSVIPMGQQATIQRPTAPAQPEAQAQGKPKGRKATLANAIRNIGSRIDAALGNDRGTETYHQEGTQEEASSAVNSVTGLLGGNESNPGGITYTDKNGNTHTLNVTSGEFDDSHQNEKQYFGRYIEFTDENGNVVARYSPYVNILEMADGLDDADSARDAIVQDMRHNGRVRLMSAGLTDDIGRLADDGNEEFRRQYRGRADTTPHGKEAHPDNLNTEQTKKRKDTRTFFQRFKDNLRERKAHEKVRRKVTKALHDQLRRIWESRVKDKRLLAKATVEALGKKYTGPLELTHEEKTDIRRKTGFIADQHSKVITARISAAAHLAGMSVSDYYKLWNLRIQTDISPFEASRGYVNFKAAETEHKEAYTDEKGVFHTAKDIFHEAETILHLSQSDMNESTILHEFAHIFLKDFQDLVASVDDLPSKIKKDWLYLTRWLGVSDIDPKSTSATRTKEQQERWQNAQEKFAVAFEQYYMTGKAPASRLKRAFQHFKQWLSSVYGAIRNIKYAGTDGHMHEVELSPKVKQIFDRMLKDASYVPNSESAKARIERTNSIQQGEEFHRQAASGVDNGQDYSRDTGEAKKLQLNLPFSPDKLRTESGNTIDEAKSSELLVTPDGSTALSYIDADTAEAAGIQAGEIQANVGVLRHAEQRHGKQITDAGYENVQTFLLDTLNNWREIRQGTANSLWLVAPKHDGHGAVAALRLHQDKDGIYRVSTLLFARNKVIDKKELLFAGRPSPASSSGSGMNLARASSVSPGTSAAKGGSSLEQPSRQSLGSEVRSVNTAGGSDVKENTTSQAITSDNDPTPEVRFAHARSTAQSAGSNAKNVNSSNTESYKQIIGIGGARRLDKAEGTTERMDNLKVARQMERAGLPVKKMWLATGWMRGKDGKWRYEIMDGEIIREKLNELRRNTKKYQDLYDNYDPNYVSSPDEDKLFDELEKIVYGTRLPDVFNAPDLYAAYPDLRDVNVLISDDLDALGVYYSDINTVEINGDKIFNNSRGLRKTLIHEIQHTIQSREGFALGSDYSPKSDAKYKHYMQKIGSILSEFDNKTRQKIIDALFMDTDEDSSTITAMLQSFSDEELRAYNSAKDALRKIDDREALLFSRYKRHSGETEARNAETRSRWSDKRRRNTPLDMSEDVPRSEQILGRLLRKSASSQFSTESYSQSRNDRQYDTGTNRLNLPFNPEELRTEKGHSIEEATPSEMIVTPSGSLDLGYIPELVAEFPSGTIRANAGSVIHAEKEHGSQIRGMGYNNAKELLLDVVNNYSEIRRGSGKALLLSAQGDARHSAMGVVELVDDNGIYRVKTLRVTRDRYLKNKELLFTRSEPNATGPDSGLTFSSEHSYSQGKPEFYARQSGNSKESVRDLLDGVNDAERNPYSSSENERYHQIVGYGAAVRLDQLNGNHNLIDNLRTAQRMERKLKPNWAISKDGAWKRDYSSARKIWLATGWFRGADGQWKFELPYGQIISKSFYELVDKLASRDNNSNPSPSELRDIPLSSFFSAPELFRAYENIKNIPVSFEDTGDDTLGYLDQDTGKIYLNDKLLRDQFSAERVLMHEIQHWIQGVEGFAKGGNQNMGWRFLGSPALADTIGIYFNPAFFRSMNAKREAQTILDSVSSEQQKVFRALFEGEANLFNNNFNNEEYEKLLSRLRPKNTRKFHTWAKLMHDAEQSFGMMHQFNAYNYFGGEVEARNAANRNPVYGDRRNNSFPLDTQDTPSEEQFIFDINSKPFSLSDNDSYRQSGRTGNISSNSEIISQSEQVRRQYEGTPQWLKAPNGKDTNLTEDQWLAVRTPNFKRWFGDWENDPQNASKVLDENGEPLVVFHGTPKGNTFSTFEVNPQGIHFGSWTAAVERAENMSGYNTTWGEFSSWDNYDEDGDYEATDEINAEIFDCFLNIRNIQVTKDLSDWTQAIIDAKKNGFDGIMYKNTVEDYGSDSYVVFLPNQIKSASENNGDYSTSNADIYKQAMIPNSELQNWSNTVDRFVNGQISRKNDGNLLHVMDTPKVFSLVGMERLPIEIRIDNMHKILLRKHHISPDTLKQIPLALADPVMIFKSEHDLSRNRDSRIVLTELKEKDSKGNERSIIAAITLGRTNLSQGYAINELSTVYKKDTSSKSNLTPDEDIYDWINRTFKDGKPMNLLLYVNKQKARQGAISSGLRPIVFDTLDGLPLSIPDEHSLARLINPTDGFISPEQLERYDQTMYHGTDNIIRGNRFDLRYAGSSEGSASRGYGAYLAENIAVAQSYRHFGDIHRGDFGITLHTNDGKTFQSMGKGNWNGRINGYMYHVLNDFYNLVTVENNPQLEGIKNELAKSYRRELSEQRKALAAMKKNTQLNSEASIKGQEEAVEFIKKKIEALKSITSMDTAQPRKGNLYTFDGPENDTLLDWDKSIARQPEKVRRARKEIIDELKYHGLDTSELKKAKTGEQFYRVLSRIMAEQTDKSFGYPASGISNPDMKASLILNMHGIPGLRFLDSGSREKGGRNGTHNFVIWNTDTLKMLGVEGNPDAEAHFRYVQEENANNESYKQILGVEAAQQLDRRNGNTNLMGNLDIAKNMMRSGSDRKTIRLATGWELAPDNLWRLEIQDGIINIPKIQKAIKNNNLPASFKLSEIYSNSELFDAYPDFADLNVAFSDTLPKNIKGLYSNDARKIEISTNQDTFGLRSTLIHEIQHAVQFREGFAEGGSREGTFTLEGNTPAAIGEKQLKAWLHFAGKNVQNVAELYSNGKRKQARELLDTLSIKEKSRWQHVKQIIDGLGWRQHSLDPYHYLGGEIEARNSETRANLSPEQRRKTTLYDTEDTHDWLIRRNGLNENFRVISQSTNTQSLLQSLRGDNNEAYHQIIGLEGARLVDETIGSDWLEHKLDLAQQMKDRGIKPKTIRRATGWEFGHDGNWRYEVQDGKLKDNIHLEATVPDFDTLGDIPFGAETQPFAVTTLGDILDATELFAAYPQLKNTHVTFIQGEDFEYNGISYPKGSSLKDGSITLEGDFHFDGSHLHPNLNENTILSLLHEVQHGIQSIEGFSAGSTLEDAARNSKAVKELDRRIEELEKQLNAMYQDNPNLSDDERLFGNDGQSQEYHDLEKKLDALILERDNIIQNSINNGSADNLYLRNAGETEARNVMTRHNFSDDQRRNTLLADTEDFPHDQLLDDNGEAYPQTATDQIPSGFITPNTLERFNQLVTHATGNIILGNKFDLSFIGSSEGTAAFGYGAYFAQNHDVAERYRRYGLPHMGLGILHVHTNDGKEFTAINPGIWENDVTAEIKTVLNELQSLTSQNNMDINRIKDLLRKRYEGNIKFLNSLKKIKKVDKARKIAAEQEKITFINSITGYDFSNPKNGNIYIFDIPEDYELLDWDKSLDNQENYIKPLIQKAVDYISEREHFDSHSATGEDLYRTLAKLLGSDMAASQYLNNLGIPGHRYWDLFSREKKSGTHNFVIWDMRKVTMTGIDQSSDKEAIDYFETYNREHADSFISPDADNETYKQIGARRKNDMDEALIKHRPDMTPQQRANAIIEIEKLGETVRQGGNPKVEKLATHWLLNGHIRLPEDNYKILDAIRISEQQHFDPMSYTDPNEILAKFTIKETKANRRINPDNVPQFSNKVQYENGITIYTVEDSEEGQAAVRRIIDTHWGKEANPWCLAARNDDGNMSKAWAYWSETYNTVDKRIAFRNGKLLAFCASDNDDVTWWDNEDEPSGGIPYTEKKNGSSFKYSYNEENGQSVKLRENMQDGTIHEFHENGITSYELLPDGTERWFYGEGMLERETLPDGTKREWFENGQLDREILADRTKREWWDNGQLAIEERSDRTKLTWWKDGKIDTETLPDGTYHAWWNDGKMRSERLTDGSRREWHENGQLEYEELPDGTIHEWNWNGQLSREELPDGTKRKWRKLDGWLEETLPNGVINSYDTQNVLRHERFPDGTTREYYKDGKTVYFERKADGTQLSYREDGTLKHKRLPDYTSISYREDGKTISQIIDADGKIHSFAPNGEEISDKQNDGFISPDILEHYEQLAYHGTGNIIWNNRFDLKFAGSSEGGAAFGFGAYFAQNPAVSKSYRQFGLSDRELAGNTSITLKNGKSFSFHDRDNWRSDYPDVARALFMLHNALYDASLNDALATVKDNYKTLINQFKGKRKKEDKAFLKRLREDFHIINSITDIKHTPPKNGNLYQFDIPEDFELLDWDKPLDEQPEQVKKSIKKIFAALNRRGVSRDELRIRSPHMGELDSGEDLYQAVVRAFEHMDRLGEDLYGLRKKGINRADARASWLFNRYGILGHRYLDGGSRDNGQGTYNFVIWNMDKITMTGIDPSSDELARKTFKNGGERQLRLFNDNDEAETYRQSEKNNSSFLEPDTLEQYQQLMYHGTRNILDGNRFDLRYLGSGEGGQAFGYGIYLAQAKGTAEYYRIAGMSDIDIAHTIFTTQDGRKIASHDRTLFKTLKQSISSLPANIKDKIKLEYLIANLSLVNPEKAATVYSAYFSSVEQALDAYLDSAGINIHDKPLVKDALKNVLPVDVQEKEPRLGNLYSVDGPEDFELLDWDAPIREQPQQVLNALKENGLFLDNNETGEQLYRRLAQIFFNENGDRKKSDMMASRALNKAGIPGLRYLDRDSRDSGQGTHNFVIWNTDTLHLLGLSDDSEQDAQDYFRAQDTYNAQLDSLDNDSDVLDYSNTNYDYDMEHIDDLADAHLDALDIGDDEQISFPPRRNMGETFRQQLNQWQDTVDAVLRKEIDANSFLKVMNTPDILQLLGIKPRPIYMNAGKILRIRNEHKTIYRDILGQIPYAISDPVAVFLGNHNGKKDILIMTDILDQFGNTVVIPLNLTYPAGKFLVTRAATVYALSRHSQLVNFFEKSSRGNTVYLNREKAADWENRTGKKLPLENVNPKFNEKDLAAFSIDDGQAKFIRRQIYVFPEVIPMDNQGNHSEAQGNSQDNETYSQTIAENDDYPYFGVDADGKQLLLKFNPPEIDAIYEHHKNNGSLFLAPNGNKSNLDNRSWLLVRTENFKHWFGDWENDPDNASKVLDENGEPLIVTHLTSAEPFSVFRTNPPYDKTRNTGAWFGNYKGDSRFQYNDFYKEGVSIYHVFLNIRNPYVYNAQGKDWEHIGKVWVHDSKTGENIYSDNLGKPFTAKRQARDYIYSELRDPYGYRYEAVEEELTTDQLVRNVRMGKLGNGHHDGVIIRDVYDMGTAHIDDFIIFKPLQVKSQFNSGAFSNEHREIYKQSANLHNSPLVERYSQPLIFANPNAEASYRNSHNLKKQKSDTSHGILHSLKELLKGFRGDFPLLAGNKGFIQAREFLRLMNRNSEAKTHLALRSLYDSLHGLNAEQFDIFSRFMLLQDIKNFALANPNAREHLPLGYNAKSLVRDYNYFIKLAKNDNAVWKAVQTEYNYNKKIRKDLVALASRLGLRSLAKRISSNDLFVIQYADLLAHNEINSNYILATGDMRSTMLLDLERLTALQKIKDKYDKKKELISKFGDNWKLHIPSGYSIFNPMANGFIQSAQSLSDTVLGMALDEAGLQLGLSDKTMDNLRSKVSDKLGTQLLVLPDEITQTLKKLTEKKQHNELTQFVKKITTGWKKYTLYAPTRVWKYNMRNITGDLDAALAGDPTCVRFIPQSMKELYTAYYGDQSKVSQELKEFQARGGALTFEAAQVLGDDKQLKEFRKLISDIDAKGNSAWQNLPRNAWNLLDKFAWSGIQKFSDFREQWLRYAVYLDYLHQMQNNPDGLPNNFGASVRDEVLALDDIRDRAFKLSNELLGAYDQVSETGKQLREILMPFYSWMEVNAKRYIQLLKNGLTEDDFVTSKLPKFLLAQIPGLGYKLLKTLFFINLFSILVNAFNHFVWPDDEEKLPPDIKYSPHITLGHDMNGNILYFTQVGALGDNLEWFGLNTFRHDLRKIFNGQLTVTDWLSQMASAPFSKLINALSPFIKTPMELATGQSLYPDFSHPRNIRDNWKYLAQSFGLSWPYKAITGEPRNDWHEFRNLFLYSADADEAAYYYTLSLVRQFKENVLGQRFSGYSENKRSVALRKLRTAIRFNDKTAMQRALKEYYSQDVGGSEKGLMTSLRNMNPLFGISDDKLILFSKWISHDDKPYIDRAQSYYKKLLRNFETGSKMPSGQNITAQPPRKKRNNQQPVRRQEQTIDLDEELLRRKKR